MTRIALKRWLVLLCLGCSSLPLQAADRPLTVYPAQQPGGVTLNIYSSTNTDRFAGLIDDYIKLNPGTTIRYQEYDSQKLYADFLAGRMATNGPDLLISSAMDLQTKLVNDGYAQTHVTNQSKALPGWAQWRNQIFGFSYEPIVLVYDTRRLPAAQVPHTHKALLNMLLDSSEPLKGKIGTYDAISSGLGYLLATQDSRMGNMANALVTALGRNHAQRAEHTSNLLDRMESGELLIGYNLLGSYVHARIARGAPLAMVLLEDYTLVITRTVLIPKTAPHPSEAAHFVDYLLSIRGQSVLAQEGGILPIREDLPRPALDFALDSSASGPMRPIRLGPGLLVYLDRWKRHNFIEDWKSALGESAVSPLPHRDEEGQGELRAR